MGLGGGGWVFLGGWGVSKHQTLVAVVIRFGIPFWWDWVNSPPIFQPILVVGLGPVHGGYEVLTHGLVNKAEPGGVGCVKLRANQPHLTDTNLNGEPFVPRLAMVGASTVIEPCERLQLIPIGNFSGSPCLYPANLKPNGVSPKGIRTPFWLVAKGQ